ncbi:MAG: TRAP transporter large permease subunit, partial [Pseudomonadota bacterium]
YLRLVRETVSALTSGLIAIALGLCGLTFLGIAAALKALWSKQLLGKIADQTTRVTTMVFTILIGAALFSLVFRGLGGDETVRHALEATPGGLIGAIAAVMLVMFVLGFFLDFIEITLVVVPLVAPVLLGMGLDPVWLGVLMAVNLQTSFLTPPFGFALFYLRGVAPPEITTLQIYKGAVPFIAIQIFALVMLFIFPQLATWLPDQIYG